MQRSLQPGTEIYWWRRVSGSIDFPYHGKIVKIGPSLIAVRVEDVATGKHVVRHVTKARVQLVGEYCAKIDEQGPSFLEPMREWGKFTRHIEVGVDLRAKRQVDLFENGHMLRYDRTHWIDSYGMLGDARINKNQLAGSWAKPEEISAHEFQSLWSRAGKSSLWKQQLKTSRSQKMGDTPIWFTRSGWQPPPLA